MRQSILKDVLFFLIHSMEWVFCYSANKISGMKVLEKNYWKFQTTRNNMKYIYIDIIL